MTRIAAAVGAFVLIVTPPLAGQGADDARLAESFLASLQRAVAVRDQPAVAGMVQYPITVFINSVRIPVQDAAAMIRVYDAIFTPELETAIAKSGFARPGRPAPAYPVAWSADGLSIASGLVRAQRIGSGFTITGLNPPPASPPPSPARPAAAPHAQGPIRVPANRTSATFSGLLMRRDEVQSYVVSARKGRVLQAEISGFRGRDAFLRVINAQSGRAVDPPVRDGARTWRGIAPTTGDYRIDVTRSAPDGGAGLRYLLVITLR